MSKLPCKPKDSRHCAACINLAEICSRRQQRVKEAMITCRFYNRLEAEEDKVSIGRQTEEERIKSQTIINLMHQTISLFDEYFTLLQRAEFISAFQLIIRFPLSRATSILGHEFFKDIGFLIDTYQSELLLLEK